MTGCRASRRISFTLGRRTWDQGKMLCLLFLPLILSGIPWRKGWQPTPIFLPGEFYGQRSLVGYNPWGGKSQTQLSDQHYSFLTYFCKRIEESFYSIPTIPAPWDSTGSTSLTVHTLASFDGELGWLGPCAFLLLWTLSMGVFQKHKGKTGLTSARMSQWEKRHSSYNCDHTQDTTLRRILFAKAGKTFPGGTQEKRKKLARD